MCTTIDSLAPARSPLAGLSASPKFLSRLPKSLKSIAVSVAPGDSTEVRRYGVIGGAHDDVLHVARKLRAAHPGAALKFCYEAGPRGYPLCRFLRAHGHDCIVVCPSRMPRRPGDRVKTDRRDADQLARLFRAGELAGIHIPEPEDAAMRDLLRTRHQIVRAQHRARQQLKMFLLRHNIRYAGTTAWTAKHLRFLGTINMPFASQQFALQELIQSISEAGARLERFDAQLEREVAGWRWETGLTGTDEPAGHLGPLAALT